MKTALAPSIPVHRSPSQFPCKPSKPKHKFSLDKRLVHLCSKGKLREAIFIIQNEPISIKHKTYISLLDSCVHSGSVELGRKLHSCINLSNKKNIYMETKLVSMYAKCGSLEDARRVFDEMKRRNLITYTTIISACVGEQRWDEVILLFYRMMHEGVLPDGFLLPRIVQACSSCGDFKTGKLLHSIAERKGFCDPKIDTHVANSILSMYIKCGQLNWAKKFLSKMVHKNVVSWNSMISGLFQCGEKEEAIRVFDLMKSEGFKPDVFTWNILLSYYSKFENTDLNYAMNLIKQMKEQGIEPDVCTWTSLISGFMQNDKYSAALKVFAEMLTAEINPNGMTISSVISACASLKKLRKGKILHCYSIKRNISKTILVANSLIDMYAKCEDLEEARKVFDKMPERDVISWNSMIAGYAQGGCFSKAFGLFSQMEKLGFKRNAVTWNAVISACFHNGDVDEAIDLFNKMEKNGIARNTASWNNLISGMVQNRHLNKALNIFRQMQFQIFTRRANRATILSIVPVLGNFVCSSKLREIHGFVMRTSLLTEPVINALITSYAKSNELDYALTLFNFAEPKTLTAWNAIITSCVLHGKAGTALALFEKMKLAGLKPYRTTMASVLEAHGFEGLIIEAEELFGTMKELYGVNANSDHYTGMINLYGRTGRLSDALDIFYKIPFYKLYPPVWDALLKVIGINGDLQLLIHITENFFMLDPLNTQIGVLLSNLYILRWKETKSIVPVSVPLKEDDMKLHGCCYIEVKNKLHYFSNGEVETNLKITVSKLTNVAIHYGLDLLPRVKSLLDHFEDEEEIGKVHSEKQAIAFGFLKFGGYNKCIKIIKNGRVCSHCHAFAKLVSKAHNREIVIKDSSCLHRFKDGDCSCRDYW